MFMFQPIVTLSLSPFILSSSSCNFLTLIVSIIRPNPKKMLLSFIFLNLQSQQIPKTTSTPNPTTSPTTLSTTVPQLLSMVQYFLSCHHLQKNHQQIHSRTLKLGPKPLTSATVTLPPILREKQKILMEKKWEKKNINVLSKF